MESEKKYLDIISDYIDIILNQRKTIDKLQERIKVLEEELENIYK